jgi:hypothetical protein
MIHVAHALMRAVSRLISTPYWVTGSLSGTGVAMSAGPARLAICNHLITGNQGHFPKFWKKTKVITSREFISIAAPHLIA